MLSVGSLYSAHLLSILTVGVLLLQTGNLPLYSASMVNEGSSPRRIIHEGACPVTVRQLEQILNDIRTGGYANERYLRECLNNQKGTDRS